MLIGAANRVRRRSLLHAQTAAVQLLQACGWSAAFNLSYSCRYGHSNNQKPGTGQGLGGGACSSALKASSPTSAWVLIRASF